MPSALCSRGSALKPTKNQRTLEPKTQGVGLVGYGAGRKAYRVHIPQTKSIVERRDVVVDEGVYDAARSTGPLAPEVGTSRPAKEAECDISPVADMLNAVPRSTTMHPKPALMDPAGHSAGITAAPQEGDGDGGANTEQGYPVSFCLGRHPTRWRAPKVTLEGAVPKANQATANVFNDEGLQDLPKSYEAAMARPDASVWRAAMRADVCTLLENEVWEPVELPEDKAVTNSPWMFELKRHAAGKVTHSQARFVVCGVSQRAGVDYGEVWARMPATGNVLSVLSALAMCSWEQNMYHSHGRP